MIENSRIAAVLKLLLEIVESATPEELEELRALSLDSLLAPVRKQKVGRVASPLKGRVVDFERTKTALSGAKTRDEALAILSGEAVTKKDLELLARSLDLPVSKEDNVDRLTSKIVEATVGSRLNSEAIRNGR